METEKKKRSKPKTENVRSSLTNGPEAVMIPAPDRIAYSEQVKINIGDYESREVFFSYSSNLQEGEDFETAAVRVKTAVRQQLHKYERKIRALTREFVDFDTKGKNIV